MTPDKVMGSEFMDACSANSLHVALAEYLKPYGVSLKAITVQWKQRIKGMGRNNESNDPLSSPQLLFTLLWGQRHGWVPNVQVHSHCFRRGEWGTPGPAELRRVVECVAKRPPRNAKASTPPPFPRGSAMSRVRGIHHQKQRGRTRQKASEGRMPQPPPQPSKTARMREWPKSKVGSPPTGQNTHKGTVQPSP